MINIYNVSLQDLKSQLEDEQIAGFRAKQIWNWLYIKMVDEFSEMKNLDQKTRQILEAKYYIPKPNVVVKSDLNSKTQKLLIELEDKNVIETVLMEYSYGNSVCVTTQVGCKIGCSFCASHLGGFVRNLTTGEIVMQIMLVNKILKQLGEHVTHVVIMGIGEPLDNLGQVLPFIDVINDADGLKIGARHITLSTSGIADKIAEIAAYDKQINLAISLHAPDNATRSKIMKINDAYPIELIIDEVDKYIAKTNRRVSFEYIMLKGINDSLEDAKKLVQLLKHKNIHINLIPYNKVDEYDYQPTESKKIAEFAKIIEDSKLQITIRNSKGNAIDGACGQLRRKYTDDRN